MSVPEHKYNFKCCCIGNSGVGKSQLTRVAQEALMSGGGGVKCQPNGDAAGFSRSTGLTVGVDFASAVVAVPSRKHPGESSNCKMQIWDTAGQESFRSVTRSYFRGSVACLVVFDLTNRESYEAVSSWHNEMLENNPKMNPAILLVGNKSDLVNLREVSTEEAEAFASERNMSAYIETSAKTGQNVAQAFLAVAEQVLEKVENGELDLQALAGTKARQNPNAAAGSSGSGAGGGASSGTVSVNANRGGMDAKPGGGEKKKCCGD